MQEKNEKKKTSSRIGVVVGMVGCGTMMQVGRGLHLHLHLHFACCFAGMVCAGTFVRAE